MKRRVKAEVQVTTADLLASTRRWDARTRKILDRLSNGLSSNEISLQLYIHHDVVLQILGRCCVAYRMASSAMLADWWNALREDEASCGGAHTVTAEDRTLLGVEAQRVLFSRWRIE